MWRRLSDRLPHDATGGTDAFPSEQEFERSLGYMRRFFQNFFDIVEDWEKGLRAPDRT